MWFKPLPSALGALRLEQGKSWGRVGVTSCWEEAVNRAAPARRGHGPTERSLWVSASLLSSAKGPINGFCDFSVITKLESV